MNNFDNSQVLSHDLTVYFGIRDYEHIRKHDHFEVRKYGPPLFDDVLSVRKEEAQKSLESFCDGLK